MRRFILSATALAVCAACGSNGSAGETDAGPAAETDGGELVVLGDGGADGAQRGDASGTDVPEPAEDGGLDSDGGATPDGGVTSGPPGEPCGALAVAPAQNVGGYAATVYSWRDATCAPRSAAMVPNDARDPAGKWGGYMRRFSYQVDGAQRVCTGENDTHPGFGFVVAHFGNSATVGHGTRGTYSTALTGKHHAIHRYNWSAMSIQGQPVNVTVQWLFATGRDHPLWAITYDLSKVTADAVEADTRSPYGDIAWDGGGGNAVAGVGWGDRYRFRSLGSPISLQSGWDYTQKNTIPHAMEWSLKPDAEMGLVQTQTYLQHDAGGYWSYSRWGMRDQDGPMPEDWNWTYQLNQYELPFTNTSKRLSWGTNYGAVGKRSYPAYGDDKQLVGWPHQSYAVFIVLGKHSAGTVDSVVGDMESVQAAKLSASVGSVATQGPAGVARTDVAPYAPAGWDHVHAAWTLALSGGKATATLDAARQLRRPLFHLRDAGKGDVQVTLDGEPLDADIDFYSSADSRDGSVWITLGYNLTGSHTLAFDTAP